MIYIHRLTHLRSHQFITLCITLLLANVITVNVYASPKLATPTSGITTFNSFPNTYTEYARTTNGASGFMATNLAGWDISAITTAGSDSFVIASENWGSGSDGALVYVGLESGTQTITSIQFASNDGKLFDLNAIDLGYDSWTGAPAISFTFTGYLEGSPVSGATLTTATFASFGNSGTWQRGISFTGNTQFQGIDEFRITPSSAVLGILDFDNLDATNFRDTETVPTLTATGGTPTFTQGSGSGVDLFSSVSAATNDSGQTFASAVFTVSQVADTTEYLTIGGTDVALTNSASGTISGVGTYSVSVASGTATVTLSGMTQAEADMDTLIDGITYKNSDASVTTGSRVVTLVSVTDSGSSNNSATVNLTATVTVQVPTTLLFPATADGIIYNLYGYNSTEGVARVATGVNPFGSEGPIGKTYLFNNRLFGFFFITEYGVGHFGYYDGRSVVDLAELDNVYDAQLSAFTEYNGDLYFTASDGNGINYHVWRYRSADDSVTKISSTLSRTGGYGLAAYNGKLYFGGTTSTNTNAPTDLYRWDGTTLELAPGFNSSAANPGQMIAYNGYLYLTATPAAQVSNIELYRYLDSGATGSVALVQEFNPTGNNIGNSTITDFTIFAGKLFFANTVNYTDGRLYSVNSANTVTMEFDPPVSNVNQPSNLVVSDGNLYFQSPNTSTKRELMRYNSTGNVTVLTTFNSDKGPTGLVAYDGDLYFVRDAGNGKELQRYDIETGTVTELSNLNPTGDSLNGNAPLVLPVAIAPTVYGGGNGLYYRRGDAPVIVNSEALVSDVDGATIVNGTVTIVSGFLAGDTLAFTNQAGITGNYNSSTGVLTLNGSASLADYQSALRTITFTTTNPATGDRQLLFQLADDTQTSSAIAAAAHSTVRVIDQTPAVIDFATQPTGLAAESSAPASLAGTFNLTTSTFGQIDFIVTNDSLTTTFGTLSPTSDAGLGLVWNDGQYAGLHSLHVVTDYTSPAYLALRSNNGGEFDFDSITYLDDGFYCGGPLCYGQIALYGFKDGTQIVTQTYSIHSQSPRKRLIGHAFDTVDEVRIRVYDPADPTFSYTPNMGLFDDITLLSSPTTLAPVSSLLWRTASNSTTGILGYDAATDRSGKIVDANPNPYDAFPGPLTRVGDYIYTMVVGPENTYQLVRYDGVNLEVLSDQLFQNIGDVTAYGDDVVFRGTLDNSTYALYLYDTSAGTVSLLGGPSPAIRPIPQSPITVIGTALYFSGGPTGSENHLYRWDGSTFSEIKTAGNSSIYPGPFEPNLIAFNNTLYLIGTVPSGRPEWWRLDGSSLSQVTNASGASTTNVEDVVVYNNRLYYAFNPTNGAGDGLNIYSIGTNASETPVTEWNPADARHLYVIDDVLYMVGTADNDGGGWDIYKYNSANSVTQVTTLDATYTARPLYLTRYAGDLYFIAGAGAESNRDLYRYDLDAPTTTKVLDSDDFGVNFADDATLVVFDQPLGASITAVRDLQGVVAGTPLPVAPALELVNITSPSLIGAKVTISSGLQAGDSLTFTTASGVTGTYDSLTGLLTLTGTATVTDYQTLLRSVSFTASDVAGDRAILFQVTDEAGTLSTATNSNALAAIGVMTSDGARTQLGFDTAPTGLSANSYTGSFSMPANGLDAINFLTTNDPLTVTLANLTPAAGADYGMTYDAASQRLSIWPSIDYTNGVVLHGTDYLVISAGNGREFDFQGLRFDEPNYIAYAYTFTGFRDGAQIDQYTFTFITGLTNTLILPTTFSNVDEVRISNGGGFYPTLAGLFDDLLILEPANNGSSTSALLTFEAGTGTLTGFDTQTLAYAHLGSSTTFTFTTATEVITTSSAMGAPDGHHGAEALYFGLNVKETAITMTIEAGKQFDLASFYLSDQNANGNETFTITTNKGGTFTATIPSDAPITTNLITAPATSAFQGVTSFTINTPAGGAWLELDDIQIHNITTTVVTNSTPTVTATGASSTFTQGSATGVDLFSGVSAATNDSGQTFASAVFTVSNVADLTEYLVISGTDVALTDGVSGTISGVGSYTVTVASGTATVMLSGLTLSDANLGTLIDGISYKNSAATVTAGERSVTLVSVTDSGSSNNRATVNLSATVTVQVSEPAIYYLSADGNGSVVGATDALNRIKPDGTGAAVIKSSIHPQPGDLALDLANQRAFFLGGTSTVPGLFGLDLTTNTVFTITTLAQQPAYGGLAYDPVADDLYYLSSDGNGTGLGVGDALHRINPDGTGATVLKSSINAGPGDLALDLANQRVFFLGATSPKPGVYSFDLTTNTVFTITTLSQAVAYGGLAYDAVHDFLYYFSTNGNGSTLGTEDALHRIKPDGTGDAVIKSSIHLGPGDLTLDIPNQRAFYLGAVPINPGVFGINLATSNVFTLTTLPTNPAHGGIVYNDDSIPTFDGSTSAPADEATTVAPSSNLALRFSEPVIKGITGTFTIRDVTANSVLETLAYTDTQIVGWTTNTLTITPSANLPAGHVIAVQWRFGAIRDYYDNYVVANATDTTYNFTVGAASDADLTVSTAGNGTGTVTSLPAGITCGLTCTATFSGGTVVTLTATADVGAVFAGWAGACSGTGNCTVTLSANQAVTATFQIIESTQPYTSITGKAGTLHAVGGYLSPITVNKTPTGLPRGIKLPLGQLSFTITGTVPGGTVQLSLYADSSLNVSSYYKRNRDTNAWVNIATAVGVAGGTTTRVAFSLTDGGPYDSDGVANGVIVDPGGAGANLLIPLVRENTLFVATLEPLTDTVTVGMPTYAIAGGADAALFTIDATTGLLQFISAPDYENPGTANTDSDGRPVYAMQVTITGATSGVDTLTLAVSLLDDPESDGVIQNLAGDYTAFTLNTPEYIDADPNSDTSGYALVGDSAASFTGGTLTITQMSGATDGSFSFDSATAFASGDDVISAGEEVTTNDSLPNAIGTIDGSADGQNGNSLVIHFNGDATARYVEEILNGLMYTAPTGGVREYYVFVNDGDGNTYGTSESVSFVMAGPTEQLQVTLAGTGSGTITSSDGELICRPDCTRAIGNSRVITLTATADSGSTFTGWNGACSGTGSCTVTMNAAKAVTATFTSNSITTTLTLTTTANPVLTLAPLTLTATLSPTGPGSVQFYVDGTPFGPAAPLVAGVAELVTTTLPIGSYVITATYTGAGLFAGSVAPSVTIAVVPYALDLSTSAALTYTEGSGAVALAPALELRDLANQLSTVQLTLTPLEADDQLAFSATSGITGTYHITTGVLALTGTGTASQWQDVLRSVTYRSSNQNPQQLTRQVAFSLFLSNSVALSDTLSVMIVPVNNTPVATGDQYMTIDIPLTVAAPGVLRNDFDPDNTWLTPTLSSGPSHGALTFNADGSFVYTVTTGYTGTDHFTYQVSDGLASSDVATATLRLMDPGEPATSYQRLGTLHGLQTATEVLPPHVALDSNGERTVLAWTDLTAPDRVNVYAQVIDSNRLTVTQVLTVATGLPFSTTQPIVVDAAIDNSGRFAVVYDGLPNGSGAADIGLQRYNADGTYTTSALIIGTSTRLDINPAVDLAGDGRIVVAYSQNTTATPPTRRFNVTIYAAFDSASANNTTSFSSSGGVIYPAVEFNADGQFLLSNCIISTGASCSLRVMATNGSFSASTIVTAAIAKPLTGASIPGTSRWRLAYVDQSNGQNQLVTRLVTPSASPTSVAPIVGSVTVLARGNPVAERVALTAGSDDTFAVAYRRLNAANQEQVMASRYDSSGTLLSARLQATNTLTLPGYGFSGATDLRRTLFGQAAQTEFTAANGELVDFQLQVNRVFGPFATADAFSTLEDTPVSGSVAANDSDLPAYYPFVYAKASDPQHGVVTFNADGSFVYTPTVEFSGADRFSYTLTNRDNVSDTTDVVFDVLAVNDTPVALDDTATVTEEQSVTIPVLNNDSDMDSGDLLQVAAVDTPAHGTVAISGTTQLVYTPTLNFAGTDYFAYTVSDSAGLTATAIVTVTVINVNDAPVAVDDAVTITEDLASTLSVLLNDQDVDSGDTLLLTAVSTPTHGAVVISGTTQLVYTPTLDFTGAAFVTYTVADTAGLTATAIVSLTVMPVNDIPLAETDSYSTTEDTPLAVSLPGVLTNDRDVEGDPLTATLVSGPSHGTLTLETDGSFVYTPTVDYNGADTFTYQANDGTAASSTTVVSLTVTAVNDAPVGVTDNYSTTQALPLPVSMPGVLGNDVDVDGDALTVQVVAGPTHGTLTLDTDGSFIYTPTVAYTGADSFTYQATDGEALSSATTVSLTILAAPTATPTVTPTHTPTPTDTSTPTPTATATVVATSTPTVTPTDVPPTATPTATGTATDVPTATPTVLPTATMTGTPTATVTATPTATALPSATPSAIATITVTLTATATDTETPQPTATGTLLPTATATATVTPTPTATATSTATPTGTLLPTATATVTPTETATDVPTNTPTATVTATATPTDLPTIMPTVTVTPTATMTVTETPMPTSTALPTATPTVTKTATDVPTATLTETPTATPSAPATATDLPTATATFTETPTAMPTATATETATELPTVTATPIATETATELPTATATATMTPTATATELPTATATDVPTSTPTTTDTPTITPTALPTATVTATPTTTPTGTLLPTATTTVTPTATATATSTATATGTATATASMTPSVTATSMATETPTATPTATATATDVPTATPTVTAAATTTATLTPTATSTATSTVTPTATATHTPTPTATLTATPIATSTPTATATASVTPIYVLAVNDAAGTLQGEAVVIRPLTNDSAPVGGTLTIIAVTTPAHGTATIDSDGQSVRYTPVANFSGLDAFSYTVQHSTGDIATANIAIVVSAKTESAAPIVAPVDTTSTTTATFHSGTHSATISVPPGTYTGTLGATDIFYIAYTAIVTPTANVSVPPTGGLQFGDLIFTLDAFVNDTRLDSYHFPAPLPLTLSYAAVEGILNPRTLQLYYWTGEQWSTDGLEFVALDESNRTITYRLAHFTEFALFGALNPTVSDEDHEPQLSNRLYLPLVTR